MPFYIIAGEVYKATSTKDAEEQFKTTKKGRMIENRGKAISIGKTYYK